MNGCVCLLTYHTVTTDFFRSSSHSYKLPEKILAKIFLTPKNPKIMNFKPPKNHFHLTHHLKSGVPL